MLTPFAVIAASAAVLAALRAPRVAIVLGAIAGTLYVHGHGVHLAANSIRNDGVDNDIAYFWASPARSRARRGGSNWRSPPASPSGQCVSPRPLLRAAAAAFALGALLIGAWAIWHGGVPEFSAL